MNEIKKCKKFSFTPVIIALVLFFRAYLLSDKGHIGISGFYPLELDFSLQSAVLLALFAVFAVFASLVFVKLGKKYGDAVSYLSLLLVAEPLLFTKQDNCINLVIWIVGLIFALNMLSEKSFIPREVTLIVFLFAACVLSENAIFLFVAPALALFFAGDAEKLLRSAKKIITLIVSLLATGAGILLNNYLVKNVPAFDNFIKSYSYHQQIYFKHIEYENILLFLFAVPTLFFGIKFFAEMFRNSKTVSAEKTNKKSDKKSEKTEALYTPVPAVVAVAVAYVLAIAGFIAGGSSAFYTINYIVPAAIISMLCSENKTAEKALEKTNKCFAKYSLVFIAVLVFVCYISVTVFYKNVDNFATFIMAS